MAIVYFRLGEPIQASKPGDSPMPAGNYCIRGMPGMNTVHTVCQAIDEPGSPPVKDRIQNIWVQFDGGDKNVIDLYTGKELITDNEMLDFAQTKLTATLFTRDPAYPFGSARFLRQGH
jgi:hypothetical protein